MFEGLSKLKGEQLFTYVLLTIALIVPGASYLYLSDSSLLNDSNLFKIITISLFYSLPIFLISTCSIIIWLTITKGELKGDEEMSILFLGSLCSLLTFYLGISIWKLINLGGSDIGSDNIPYFIYTSPLLIPIALSTQKYFEKVYFK